MDVNPAPLWRPNDARLRAARINDYIAWLARHRGRRCDDYDALWRWSTQHGDEFWGSLWDYFDVGGTRAGGPVLRGERMPRVEWFPGCTLNYVDQVFRHRTDERPAIMAGDETGALSAISWAELERRVACLARELRRRGVTAGDRVAAFLPNTPDAAVAFLATASLGAIWSICSPDMGAGSVLDRFRQIGPKVLIAVDGYRHGGREHDRAQVVAELRNGLPTVELFIRVGGARTDHPGTGGILDWHRLIERPVAGEPGTAPVEATPVPFDHPLWIVYSSGTTGPPKPIVHGHGGIVLEHLKLMGLHNDLGPADRFHWYSSTGWIMWNCQMAGLLVGATVCLYDGSPGWPDAGVLWRFADAAGVSFFGSGAAFYSASMKAAVTPRPPGALAKLRTIGSTGSPLSVDAYRWLQRELGEDVWIAPISGGTDVATAFVGGIPILPVYAGEMQCRCLGVAAAAWNDAGESVTEEVGELVCTAPMPSMPLRFWNDPGDRRYRESYFEMFPGVWRHGDWIEITRRGGAIVYGRSDATLNRHGIRLGTSELYAAVEALPEVQDSLVVDLQYLGRKSFMPLFVVLRSGAALDDALKERIRAAVRRALSPRHVPDEIYAAPQIPRTLSGKKLEVPIKRLFLGEPLDRLVNRDALANPESLAWYVDFARGFRPSR